MRCRTSMPRTSPPPSPCGSGRAWMDPSTISPRTRHIPIGGSADGEEPPAGASSVLHPGLFLRLAAWAATMLKRALGKKGKVDVEYALAAATRNLRYANIRARRISDGPPPRRIASLADAVHPPEWEWSSFPTTLTIRVSDGKRRPSCAGDVRWMWCACARPARRRRRR